MWNCSLEKRIHIHSANQVPHWTAEFLFYDILGVWPRWWLQSFHMDWWRRKAKWWKTRLATQDGRYPYFVLDKFTQMTLITWVFPPNFSNAQCRMLKLQRSTKEKKNHSWSYPLVQSVLATCPAKMGVPLLSTLFFLPHSLSTCCSPLPFCLINSFPSFLSSQNLPSAPRICSLPGPIISPSAVIPELFPWGRIRGTERRTKVPSLSLVFQEAISLEFSRETAILNVILSDT